MKPVVILACVLFAIAVIRIIRLPHRRDINVLQAIGCACLGFGSGLEIRPLLYLAGVFFVLSIYRHLTWKKRMMKEIQEIAGLSDEDVVRLDEKSRKEEEEDARREAEEEEKRTEAEAAAADYRIEANPEVLKVSVELPKAIRFPAGENGVLEWGPGNCQLGLEIGSESVEGDEAPALRLKTIVNDEDGNTWETVTYSDSDILLAGVLEGQGLISGSDLVPWPEISVEWREVLRNRCQVSGMGALLDSRDYYDIDISGTVYTIREKYQGPVMDLAWRKESGEFLVRVAGLYHVNAGDVGDIPPFVFARPPDFLLPLAPHLHWSGLLEWIEFDEDEKAPIAFKPSKESADLRASAKFLSDNPAEGP